MQHWSHLTSLFNLVRPMTVQLIDRIADDQFDSVQGGGNSPKWILGHLAVGMDFGLNILGRPTEHLDAMMPTYGPGSPGGVIGDDGYTRKSLRQHFQIAGDQLAAAVIAIDDKTQSKLNQPNTTPFLTETLPTMGHLLAHVYTTHLAMHTGQLSEINRQLGRDPLLTFG